MSNPLSGSNSTMEIMLSTPMCTESSPLTELLFCIVLLCMKAVSLNCRLSGESVISSLETVVRSSFRAAQQKDLTGTKARSESPTTTDAKLSSMMRLASNSPRRHNHVRKPEKYLGGYQRD